MDGRTADIRRAVWRLLAGILVLLSVVGGADAAAPNWACRVDGGDAECRAPEVGPPWWNTAELGEFQDHCGNPFPDGQVRCPSEELSWTQSDAELTAAWLACSIDRDLLREEEQTYLGVVKSIKKDYAITITHSNPYDSAPCQRTYTVSLLGFVWATADRDVSCPPGYTPSAQGCWRAKPEACPQGNPIQCAGGEKMLHELDYRGQGALPLEFERHYTSAGYFVPRGQILPNEVLGRSWRHTYQRTIVSVPAQTPQQTGLAYAVRPDGDYRHFRRVNDIWVGRSDTPERLIELRDASGARTGWQ